MDGEASANSIGVFDTLGKAINVVTAEFGRFLQLAVIAWVQAFAIAFVIGFPLGFVRFSGAARLASWIAESLIGSLFLLAIHRYQLAGWTADLRWLALRWTRREAAFVALLAIPQVLFVLPHTVLRLAADSSHPVMRALANTDALVWALIFMPFAVVLALPRIAFILPSIADGSPDPIAKGWRLGRRVWLKVLGITLLQGIPLLVLNRMLKGDAYWSAASSIIAYYLIPAITAVAICAIYSRLTGIALPAPLVERDRVAPAPPLSPEEAERLRILDKISR
jgi:hypothetical protein